MIHCRGYYRHTWWKTWRSWSHGKQLIYRLSHWTYVENVSTSIALASGMQHISCSRFDNRDDWCNFICIIICHNVWYENTIHHGCASSLYQAYSSIRCMDYNYNNHYDDTILNCTSDSQLEAIHPVWHNNIIYNVQLTAQSVQCTFSLISHNANLIMSTKVTAYCHCSPCLYALPTRFSRPIRTIQYAVVLYWQCYGTIFCCF